MKLAVFADIHTNYHAFKACFERAKQEKAEGFILLGDYITDMAYPGRTMDLVYKIKNIYPCHIVRGNREAYILAHHAGRENFLPGSNTGSLYYTYQNLREADIAFIQSLPYAAKIRIDGARIAIAHSTFESDRFYFDPSRPSMQEAFAKMPEKVLLTGHSHIQYAAQRGGKTIINPGSVGYATNVKARAQFAMLDVEKGRMDWEMFSIPYDLRATIEDQFESGLVDCAHYWALSILNTLLMGKNMAMAVLKRAEAYRDAGEDMTTEEVWQKASADAGLILEKDKLIRMCQEVCMND